MGKHPMSLAEAITQDVVRDGVSATLRTKLRWMKNTVKFLCGRYDWGDRKAESIFYGQNAPTSADLLKLMADHDEVFEWALRTTGRYYVWEQHIAEKAKARVDANDAYRKSRHEAMESTGTNVS